MTLVVASIYAGAVLLCVGTTALLVRTWSRRRYLHKSLATCITSSSVRRCSKRWNWSSGRFATRGGARHMGWGSLAHPSSYRRRDLAPPAVPQKRRVRVVVALRSLFSEETF